MGTLQNSDKLVVNMLLKGTALFSLVAAATATDYEWLAWKQQHKKSYPKYEENHRYGIFGKNRQHVMTHNEQAANGEHTFTLGLNRFADLTTAEFEATYLSPTPNPVVGAQYQCPEKYTSSMTSSDLPTTWDWRDPTMNTAGLNAVTAVKDQGSCGSCWTFGATGTMEGSLCMQGSFDCNTWTGLSEQELVDCASYNKTFLGTYNDHGCNGGEQSNAIRWVNLNGGITDEPSYPYTAKDGTCQVPPSVATTTSDVCGTTSYNGPDATLLAAATMEKGPVTIGIDASGIEFQLYAGGVYSSTHCSPNGINHAVLAVGFGNDGLDYWMVKNSWGTAWGLAGYINMERGVDMCGCERDTQYALMA